MKQKDWLYIAGNPAKIISYKDHSDLRLRVWKNNI